MKIIHSYWSKPYLNNVSLENKEFESNYYRLNQKINLFHQALSCIQAKKHLGKIHLVTDSYGKHLIIDKLKFPYDSVSCELDELDSYSEKLWALGKIKAYQLQKEPFVHIDSDLFIWKNMTPKLSKSLVSQNIDSNSDSYRFAINEMINFGIEFPNWINTKEFAQKDITAVNAGFIGGNDIDFIYDYTCEVFKFININLNKTISNNTAIVYEQLFFYLYSKFKGKNIHPIVEEKLINDGTITDITNAVTSKRDFCHLISKQKIDAFSCYYVTLLLKTKCYSLYQEIINFN